MCIFQVICSNGLQLFPFRLFQNLPGLSIVVMWVSAWSAILNIVLLPTPSNCWRVRIISVDNAIILYILMLEFQFRKWVDYVKRCLNRKIYYREKEVINVSRILMLTTPLIRIIYNERFWILRNSISLHNPFYRWFTVDYIFIGFRRNILYSNIVIVNNTWFIGTSLPFSFLTLGNVILSTKKWLYLV